MSKKFGFQSVSIFVVSAVRGKPYTQKCWPKSIKKTDKYNLGHIEDEKSLEDNNEAIYN